MSRAEAVIRTPTVWEMVGKNLHAFLRRYIPAMRSCCEHCDDGTGTSGYPMYGVAPHKCFYKIPGAVMGESVELPEGDWPKCFEIDPEMNTPGGGPRCGIYWRCPFCDNSSTGR